MTSEGMIEIAPAQRTALRCEYGLADCGHGHVYPREGGIRVRCGGPAICRLCARDYVQLLEKVRVTGQEPRKMIPVAHATMAVGWLASELAARASAWTDEPPAWFPQPPEWLDLWERALDETAVAAAAEEI